jgi:hypothetical protein
VLELPGGRKIGGQAAQAMYEITVLEEYAKLNDLTGTITVASGISAKVGDLTLTDSVEGTYVRTHLEEECPRTLVQLYRGPIKIFSNHSSTLEGGLALMEDRAKEQVAGLEMGTMFVLCGNFALHTHIPNIAVFTHQDHRMEVATGRFKEQPAGTDVTKLETSMSFLQIKVSMGLHEKIRQVRHEICQNRRETAHVRLEAIAGADNPYSLLQVFGRGHVITKSGAVAYVTRCIPVEVLPRVSNNCTEKIPVTWNGTSLYVDPISYVIKSAASPTRCNDIPLPRWKIAEQWYCAYPSIRECAPPRDLPVKPVDIEDEDVLTWAKGGPSTVRPRWRSS